MGARKAFGAKLREAGKVLREQEAHEDGGIIGVVNDDDESADGDGED
jgi:periodic tryptophan protein 1